MEAARGRRVRWASALAPLLGLLAGCGLGRPHVDQDLLARQAPAGSRESAEAGYVVRFPDVLDVRVEGRPGWSGRRRVGIDGRIGPDGVRADGHTLPEIARLLAEKAGVPAEAVRVAVAEYNSQQLFLHGEVKGESRAVPYRGPETVLDLLQRVGGITPGAAPQDVQVVRSHVVEGKPP